MATETETATTVDAQTLDNNEPSHARHTLNLFGNELVVEDYRDVVEIFYSGKLGRRVMYGNGGQGRKNNTSRGDKVRLVVDGDGMSDGDIERVTVWSDREQAESIKDTYWRANARWDDETHKWTIDAEFIVTFVDDLLYNGEDVQLSMDVVELLAQ